MKGIKLRVNAGEAKSGPPLAPILGQHQINLMEFCKTFNLLSQNYYSPGVPVRVRVLKQPGLPLKYVFKPITFYTLIMNFLLYINHSKAVTLEQLYDIFLIRLHELKVLENLELSTLSKVNLAKQLFGFLISKKVLLK
jgi:ribosomal protein L11